MASGIRGSLRLGMVGLLCSHHAQPRTKFLIVPRGICPAIPYRQNAATKPAFFPKILYKGRARAEQGVGKIKRFKRIALRCEKTAQNFAAFISLACTFILVKSVHTT